jgi:hypothetical protein
VLQQWRSHVIRYTVYIKYSDEPLFDLASQALNHHLEHFFIGHTVSRVARKLPHGRLPDFSVYEISPGQKFNGWLYVTDGCWMMGESSQGHGLEFCLAVNQKSERQVVLLSMLAHYHAGYRSHYLDLGHTVPIGEPWSVGSVLNHELIALPYSLGTEFEHYEWGSGHGRILEVIPISERERDYKVKHGLEALESRFEKASIDFTNPLRKSVI